MSEFEAKCGYGHQLELVAEGYAICVEVTRSGRSMFFPWRLTPPAPHYAHRWRCDRIIGRDEYPIDAWVGWICDSREEAIEFIQADAEAHRALPFDEESERARLMPV